MNHDASNRNSGFALHDAPDAHGDGLDRLLAEHFASGEELAPSSGFAGMVMESIKAEAEAPPPIRFPWRRALPGAVAVLVAMIAFLGLVIRAWRSIPGSASSTAPAIPPGEWFAAFAPHLTLVEQALVWSAVAVCLSLAVAMGSIRLARGSGR